MFLKDETWQVCGHSNENYKQCYHKVLFVFIFLHDQICNLELGIKGYISQCSHLGLYTV